MSSQGSQAAPILLSVAALAVAILATVLSYELSSRAYSELEARQLDVAADVDRLASRVEDLSESVKRLWALVDDIGGRLESIEAELRRLATRPDLEELRREVEELRTAYDELHREVEQLRSHVDSLARRLAGENVSAGSTGREAATRGFTVVEKRLQLETCQYAIIPVNLSRGDTIVVRWASDVKSTYVGIGFKDEVASFRSNFFCEFATIGFYTYFEETGYGYSGEISYTAPVDAEYYVVVLHGWHPGEATGTIRVTIEVRRGS